MGSLSIVQPRELSPAQKSLILPACGIILCSLLLGCEPVSDREQTKAKQHLITARDNGEQPLKRHPIYRAVAPLHWGCSYPHPEASIADTTLANCTFYIQEEDQKIRLTIHTFPITSAGQQIPPLHQITRWKKQLDNLDPLTTSISPISRGGFSGLFFEGEGTIEGIPTKIMGWSMQLAPVYERELENGRLQRADYTIKAVGPPSLMEKNRKTIMDFAESFELIEELPAPT